MSNIIAEIFKVEIAKAEAEGKEKNLNMTAQPAMEILEVPENEQEKYLSLI